MPTDVPRADATAPVSRLRPTHTSAMPSRIKTSGAERTTTALNRHAVALVALMAALLLPALLPSVAAATPHKKTAPHKVKSNRANAKKVCTVSRHSVHRNAVRRISCKSAQDTGRGPKPQPAPVRVVQTVGGYENLTALPGLSFSRTPPSDVALIPVNEAIHYQQFTGVGAAMTDSSAWLIHDQLSPAVGAQLIHQLFGADGLHLNFVRVPMGASDFTAGGAPYSYDDMPAGQSDPMLSQFSIAHDLPYIIPTLQQVLQVNPGIEVLANPWSPPAWMKADDSMNDFDGGTLLDSAYEPFAQYFVKFMQAYEAQGIPIDAITPENEPALSWNVGFPGMSWTASGQQAFISQNLGPALAAAGLHPKIYGNDLSWDQANNASALISGPAAGDLAGIAWHCYAGTPTAMSQLHQAFPNADQIVDECSPEIRPMNTAETLISAFRNWASTVSVWNLALNPNGGPVQAPNKGCTGCTGVVTISEQAHTVSYGQKFYQLGQVSKFVHPGAVRIDSPNFVSYTTDSNNWAAVTPGMDDVAFLNPDGSKVFIAYNNAPAATSFAVQTDRRYFTYRIPARAMTTFTWR